MILTHYGNNDSLTVSGKPTAQSKLVAAWLDALFPMIIAVCKCETHTYSEDSVCLCSSRADAAVKTAAKQTVKPDQNHTNAISQRSAGYHAKRDCRPRGIDDGMQKNTC